MGGLLQDVLAGEAPMAPSEITDLVHAEQIEGGGCRGGEGEGLQIDSCRGILYVLEKLSVVSWAVGAEVLEDGGKRGSGHGDLEKVVHEWDLKAS